MAHKGRPYPVAFRRDLSKRLPGFPLIPQYMTWEGFNIGGTGGATIPNVRYISDGAPLVDAIGRVRWFINVTAQGGPPSCNAFITQLLWHTEEWCRFSILVSVAGASQGTTYNSVDDAIYPAHVFGSPAGSTNPTVLSIVSGGRCDPSPYALI